jgi:cytochrome c-type biogenesis protein CcmF
MVNAGMIIFVLPLVISFMQALKAFSKKDIIKISDETLAKFIFATVLISYAFLTYKFAVSDFSYSIVLMNSHTLKPMLYKITGVWGNHEGSMLLFILILSFYSFLYAKFSKFPLKEEVLGMQGFVMFMVLLYTYFTSNPFDPVAEMYVGATEGLGLNPLLQDIGLAIHPPMLYAGYAGFSIAFSITLVVLKNKIVDKIWAEFARPWTLAAWSFLTIGVGLGSWWAYRELGWGGFWFWDPVENVSLVPWLFGSALIHGILCVKKFNKFVLPTLFLALITFLSSLLGFFLVRSGILSSVHSFASDPTRGIMMLAVIFVISSYAMIRLGKGFMEMDPQTEGQTDFISREVAILFQMIILMAMAATILLGVMYPMLLEIFFESRISVGEPYFNAVFVPIALGLIILMVFAPILKWQREKGLTVLKKSLLSFVASAAIAIFVKNKYADEVSVFAAFSIFACSWLAISAIEIISRRALAKEKISKGFASMIISHAAFGLLGLAITLVVTFESDRQLAIEKGGSISIEKYSLKLNSSEIIKGKNYLAQKTDFTLSEGDKEIATLSPENRIYFPELTKTHETSVDYGILRDVYVVLGQTEQDKNDGDYLFPTRVYFKPFIFFIWFSVVMMAFGGFLAMLPKKK